MKTRNLLCPRGLSVAALALSIIGAGGPATARDIRLFDAEGRPGGFFGVPWVAELGEGLVPWAALWLDHADDELVATGGGGPRTALVDHRTTASLSAGLNILSVAALSVSVPVHLAGGVDVPSAPLGGDVALRARVRIAGEDDRGVGLGLSAGLTLPTGSVDGFTGVGGVGGHIGLLAHWQNTDGFRLASAFVWRFRPTTTLEGEPLGADLRLGFAGTAPLHRRLGLVGELDVVVGESGTGRRTLTAVHAVEGRLGLAAALGAGFELRGFWGAGLTAGLGAPDYRLGLGLAWRPATSDTPAPPGVDEGVGGEVPESGAEPGPEGGAAPGASSPGPAGFGAVLAADPDPDGDGVVGATDACPNAPEDMDGHADDDGCPEPDNDGDGILDTRDACPDAPETFNGVDDADGCPEEAAEAVAGAAVEERDGALEVGEIPFRSGSDMLREDAVTRLETLAAFLRARTGIRRLVIEGHTDNAGDPEFNVDLSERRAARVRSYLIAAGIAPTRLVARGYGATRPVAPNSSERGRAQNRRVVFRIDRDFGATPGSASPKPLPPGPEDGR